MFRKAIDVLTTMMTLDTHTGQALRRAVAETRGEASNTFAAAVPAPATRKNIVTAKKSGVLRAAQRGNGVLRKFVARVKGIRQRLSATEQNVILYGLRHDRAGE